MIIVGIDLAGKEENPSGICVLDKKLKIKLILKSLYSNEAILKEIETWKPSLVVIDAPLSLPQGRCCLEKDCDCAVGGHFRRAEEEIRSYGRVLPLTFKGMKMLTLRGIKLANKLRTGCEVIETHPRTVQRTLGFITLEHVGKFLELPAEASEHEVDAVLAAVTGYLYLKGCFIQLGDSQEGTIIIPKDNGCLGLF